MIRQFRDEDAGACSELIRECILCEPSLSAEVRRRLLMSETEELMRGRSRLFYVAVSELDAGIAGLAGLDLNEIRLLYVSPAQQRKGVGSAMLNHLEAMVPPGFFKDIFVYATPGAAEFYMARGYHAGGVYKFPVGELTVPTVFMTKPIAEGQLPVSPRKIGDCPQ
jgi:GNAT superfamily N-acetyltransferase